MMDINCGGREETCILSDEQNGIDRMSSLPDDVRKHILSFLSTREAVQTCVLSKKWINTWASMSDLKFDIKEFIDDDMEEFELSEISEDMAVELVTKFELLVKSVLDKREISCVNIFQLWLDSGVFWPCTQVVPDRICDAMKLEPREFLVKLRSCENFNLNTDLIFTCASLIHLQLHLSSKVDPFATMEPNSINLPRLKTLNLYGVIMSDDSLKKLLLGCPVLEQLVLESFYIEGIIKICSNTLKVLVLRNYHKVMRLEISTPNLLYLVISMCTREILLLKMPVLVYASINIPGWYDEDIYLTMGPKLIHNLSNVKCLRLELHCPKGKVQKKDFSKCPVFNNLKHLELVMTLVFYIFEKSWGFYVFDLVQFFLHQSPELQELTLYGNLEIKCHFISRNRFHLWCDPGYNSPYWPNIALSFSAPAGYSRHAHMVLRKGNYIVTGDNSGLECVAILPTSNQGYSVIGSMAQLDREMIFDLDQNNLYFDQYPEMRFSCDTKPTIALNLVVVYFIILLLFW